MADTVKRIADGLGVPQTVFSDWPLSRRMRHPASRLSFANADERQAAFLYREKYRAPYHTDEAVHYDYPLSANDDHGTSPDTALFGRAFTLSQSKLDRYASCPFSFFCHYGMVLQEERIAEISAPDIGTFVHAILEQFFRECAGRTYPIPETETEEMADRLIAEYLRALGIDPANGRLAYLFTRLRRHVLVFLEAVMREFAQSRFVPAAFEIPMGASEGRGGIASLSLPLDNGMTVSLTGTIDRIDTYTAADGKKYVRVVDYKTGGATFSLADIREGLHVQLLLYLFTLWKGKTPFQTGENGDTLQPAGAVYLTVRPQEKAADDMMEPSDARELALSGLTRSGIYLDDRERGSCVDGAVRTAVYGADGHHPHDCRRDRKRDLPRETPRQKRLDTMRLLRHASGLPIPQKKRMTQRDMHPPTASHHRESDYGKNTVYPRAERCDPLERRQSSFIGGGRLRQNGDADRADPLAAHA